MQLNRQRPSNSIDTSLLAWVKSNSRDLNSSGCPETWQCIQYSGKWAETWSSLIIYIYIYTWIDRHRYRYRYRYRYMYNSTIYTHSTIVLSFFKCRENWHALFTCCGPCSIPLAYNGFVQRPGWSVIVNDFYFSSCKLWSQHQTKPQMHITKLSLFLDHSNSLIRRQFLYSVC